MRGQLTGQRHPTTEMLSAYLDRELKEGRMEELAGHLEACQACRHRLGSLERVVDRLQGVERAAPPALLAGQVARRVALEERTRGLLERLEGHLSGNPLQSNVFLTFALVFAFATMIYVFAHGVDRIERKRIPVRVASPEMSKELLRQHRVAVEPAPAGGVEERVFERGDLAEPWRERGVEGPPRERVAVSSEEGLALLERHPQLSVLLAAGGSVILDDGGRVVEVVPE